MTNLEITFLTMHVLTLVYMAATAGIKRARKEADQTVMDTLMELKKEDLALWNGLRDLVDKLKR